jgi:hypothetical protein
LPALPLAQAPELAPALLPKLPPFHLHPLSTPSTSGCCLNLQKLENWKNRSIKELIRRGTKSICKKRRRKTKTKSKDYVIHE